MSFAVFSIIEKDNIIPTFNQKNVEQTMIVADCEKK
jgi:hypothetical protein